MGHISVSTCCRIAGVYACIALLLSSCDLPADECSEWPDIYFHKVAQAITDYKYDRYFQYVRCIEDLDAIHEGATLLGYATGRHEYFANAPRRQRLMLGLNGGVGVASIFVSDLLKRGAGPTLLQPDGGLQPIHFAVYHGDLSAVWLLLKYGADPNPEPASNPAPLEIAVSNCDFDMYRMLLDFGASTEKLPDEIMHEELSGCQSIE